MTSTQLAQEAYYESETALRLVDHDLRELREDPHAGPDVLGELETLLARVHAVRTSNEQRELPAFLREVERSLSDVISRFEPAE